MLIYHSRWFLVSQNRGFPFSSTSARTIWWLRICWLHWSLFLHPQNCIWMSLGIKGSWLWSFQSCWQHACLSDCKTDGSSGLVVDKMQWIRTEFRVIGMMFLLRVLFACRFDTLILCTVTGTPPPGKIVFTKVWTKITLNRDRGFQISVSMPP